MTSPEDGQPERAEIAVDDLRGPLIRPPPDRPDLTHRSDLLLRRKAS
jgi:hypothetical protein